jgi:hypothetical protein
MNNRGTKIDWWGTLCFNALQPEKKIWGELGDLTSTFCLPLVKKDLYLSSDTPQIPQKCNLANTISWFTQPKVFAKSYKIPPTCIFWLTDLNTLSARLKAASSIDTLSVSLKASPSVDTPFLKPVCC